jgi:hypothetical protein
MALLDSVRYGVAAAFTLATGLFPVTAALRDEAEVRTDFTWDMFAVARECEVCVFHYEVGGERQRLPWGFRGTPATLDPWGRGALLVDPRGPALNLRTPVQVARVRHTNRLEQLGGEVCDVFREVFDEIRDGTWDGPVHRWLVPLHARYRESGGQIAVVAQCDCRFADEPYRPLVDPDRNLCAPSPSGP